jgi:hypothetical protein
MQEFYGLLQSLRCETFPVFHQIRYAASRFNLNYYGAARQLDTKVAKLKVHIRLDRQSVCATLPRDVRQAKFFSQCPERGEGKGFGILARHDWRWYAA